MSKTPSDSLHLKKWVQEFVTLARKRNAFTDFWLSPCQIIAIFIKEEKSIIVLVRHDPEEADQHIVAIYSQSREEAIHIIDSKILADAYYLKKGYAIEIAAVLGRILSRHAFIPKEPNVLGLGYFKDHQISDGYMLIGCVNIEKDTPKRLFPSRERRSIPTPPTEIENYIASMWYPPIAFEDEPITIGKASVFQTEYKGHKVVFDNKSFISVLVSIKPPIMPFADKAVDLMNEIIATANILGVAGIAVTTEDIVTFTFPKGTEHLDSLGFWEKPTMRSLLFKDFRDYPTRIYEFDSFLPFRMINKSLMKDIIRKAEKITANKEMKNYLSLFLDVTTHMLTGASKAAFLHGWIVIEKYIDDVWSKTLAQQGITGNRRKKLSESILWTTDDKLEVLNLIGIVPNERYVEMIRLKRIRNAIVHEERSVHPGEAKECLGLCKSIVSELIRSRCYVEV